MSNWFKLMFSIGLVAVGFLMFFQTGLFFLKAQTAVVEVKNVSVVAGPKGGYRVLTVSFGDGRMTDMRAYFGTYEIGQKIKVYYDPANWHDVKVNVFYYFVGWGFLIVFGLAFLNGLRKAVGERIEKDEGALGILEVEKKSTKK